jgi:hypothetical protein
MMEENSPKIPPPLEHVEQLIAVDQSRRDDQKSGQRRSKRHARRKDMEQILEEEQHRPSRDDGHVDYRA